MNNIIKVIAYIWKEPSNKGERLKRLFYGVNWQIWKRTIKKPIILTLDNGAYFISFPKVVMCSFPIYTKIYDSRNIQFVRSFLKGKGVMIDIGANLGVYSLLLKDKIKKAILFEPLPETAEMCQMNLSLNKLDYELNRLALGNFSGYVYFDYKGNADSTAKISPQTKGIKIRIDKLEHLLNEETFRNVEFMKIDVEGYELEVLKGGKKIFGESSLRLVQFERLKITPLEKFIEFFKNYSWEVFAINNENKITFHEKDIKEAHDLFARKIKAK